MTLVEFIAPLAKAPHRDRVLAVLYFKTHYENIHALTVTDIRQSLRGARAPSWSKVNVSNVLSRSGHYVDSSAVRGRTRAWSLTESGDQYVRQLLGLAPPHPEIEHDTATLSHMVSAISDPDIKDYVEESIKCLQVGALRAAVVFLWSGAMRTLHSEMLGEGRQRLNAALQKHDPKSRPVNRIDHFAYIKDRISLLAAADLGLLDKSEKGTLLEALNLRNRCGHPGKYKPGVKKVSSFVEDVLSIVFR